MSVHRAISLSRFALTRGFTSRRATGSILHLASTAARPRHFTSSARIQEGAIQTPATGPKVPLTAARNGAPGKNAHAIAITKLPWNTAPSDVQQLLRDAGVNVKKLQFRVERFTFQSDTCAFVELGGKEQVQKAVKALDSLKLGTRTLKVSPLSDTFYWDSGFKKDQRFFFYDTTTPSQAIQGLLEGRRYTIFVENPGWPTKKDADKSVNVQRRELLNKVFEPFNVEAFGGINPVWKTDKRNNMTFLTHVEFATKEDALRAMDALNNTVIEGKRVELRPHTIIAKRAEQIGKVDEGVLTQLQEAGLLTTEPGPASM
ncbi:hypothetical protein E8E12_010676 [Didymella heteroderae]|uniref:RRM domain-containing protein n=1 Tax=Didymella heteroderae TaxID=1769908 RepID=A0A9P5C4T6_9PLEO|nr:hypothetical protein E8E12_010676 [Didymella heteroderae]